jgi:hypothetical protein
MPKVFASGRVSDLNRKEAKWRPALWLYPPERLLLNAIELLLQLSTI